MIIVRSKKSSSRRAITPKNDLMLSVKCWWAGTIVHQLDVLESQLTATLEEIEHKLSKGSIVTTMVGTRFIPTELCIDIHYKSGGYFMRHDIKK